MELLQNLVTCSSAIYFSYIQKLANIVYLSNNVSHNPKNMVRSCVAQATCSKINQVLRFFIATMSRKLKAIFTIEETAQLTELFDVGLDSVSKEKADAIRDAAKKLSKTEQEIKVYKCVYL